MEELKLLSDTVRQILGTVPEAEDEAGWSPSAWKELEPAGLTRVGVPERFGGSGGDLAEVAVVLHAVGHCAAPVPLAEATLGGWLLAGGGIPLPDGPLSVGEGATAAPAGNGWMLGGVVQRVPWGRHAGNVAVLATSGSGPVVALVAAGEYRVSHGRNLAGEPRDSLDLSGVVVPPERAAAVPTAVADQLRLRGALCRVLLMAGAAEHVLAMSVRYAQERVQFGRPIAKFQAVQHQLARIAAEAAVLRAASRAALRAVREEPDRWQPVAAARVRAGRAAGETATLAHQVHGAMGVTWEHGLRRLTTRLWAWRDECGNESEWASEIGAWMVRTGPGALRTALTDDRIPGRVT
jgi:acyl-CoA dehydrogenase